MWMKNMCIHEYVFMYDDVTLCKVILCLYKDCPNKGIDHYNAVEGGYMYTLSQIRI